MSRPQVLGQLILEMFLLIIHPSAGFHKTKSVFGCTFVTILFKCLINNCLWGDLEELSKTIYDETVKIYKQFLQRKRQGETEVGGCSFQHL